MAVSFSFARFERSFIARLLLAGLFCVALSAEALAKKDPWPVCRDGAPEARIAACTEILARGSKQTKRNQLAAYINRSSAYQAAGDLDRAIADLDKALRLNPKSPLALTKRAAIHQEKGDLDRAIADYSSALRLDKNLPVAYRGRAKAYQAKGDLDKALSDFGEALRIDPQSAALYAERGAAYQAQNNLDLALADFSKAAEIDPTFSDAFLNRANIYRGRQDLEHARQDYETALKLDPQLAPAKQALDELNAISAKNTEPPSSPHDHRNLPWPLALPFAGMLLSIALGPLVVKEWWHIHYEKAAAFWAILTLAGLAAVEGPSATLAGFVHNMALDYIPFILMLFALFTAAGGIVIEGELKGSPKVNVAILALGTMTASLVGTTGASMILIRPLIRANKARPFNAHVVVFFIFLVSNIGGALTPLGDPPLFLGYLHGVDFFWTMRALWPQTLFAAAVLLVSFFLVDTYLFRREKHHPQIVDAQREGLRVRGLVNICLIGIAVLAIVASGVWRPGIGFEVLGTRIELQNLVRELVMILVGLASLRLTNAHLRAANGFEWEPIREVAYLFAGIFICIIPVMAMLQAGTSGPFSAVIQALSHADGTPNNAVYFWATGLLSSFLDNAPTYLVFFELAGGDPATLMGSLSKTLTAISLGAVFMGANTYIGNAPNFMVYAIARRTGVRMPGFFPYMLWSGAILLPLFVAVTWLFLR